MVQLYGMVHLNDLYGIYRNNAKNNVGVTPVAMGLWSVVYTAASRTYY